MLTRKYSCFKPDQVQTFTFGDIVTSERIGKISVIESDEIAINVSKDSLIGCPDIFELKGGLDSVWYATDCLWSTGQFPGIDANCLTRLI